MNGLTTSFTAGLLLPVAFAIALETKQAGAAEYKAASAAEIAALSDTLKPGDAVVLKNGAWKDQALTFRGRGTAMQPILYRAETPGQVVLQGKSAVTIDGEEVAVSGIHLDHVLSTGDGIKVAGRSCRLTESAVVGGSCKFFVHLFGTSNRIDHCYLAGKTNDSPTLQVEVEGRPNHHLIDHNHFGPRPPLGRNGGETMRIGYSHQSMTNSSTVVEYNLYDRCDGELEIISSKSCDNIYRCNTFLDCAGTLTLRHGNRCIVERNFFIGHHKPGSGGIRVIGEDHIVANNYMEGLVQGGFWITSGIPDSELKGYFQARNCIIAYNTFVDSRGPAIQLDAGIGSSGRTLRPEDITIANNLLAVTEGALLKGKEGHGFKWAGNIAAATGASEQAGVRLTDPRLERGKDGLWRPAHDSPARGGAEPISLAAPLDIDGQPRGSRKDVGCDQSSAEPIANKPLTSRDTGPAWMKREGN